MKKAKLVRSGKWASLSRRPDDVEILRAADEVCRRDFLSFA
jgi:hypothetical protein